MESTFSASARPSMITTSRLGLLLSPDSSLNKYAWSSPVYWASRYLDFPERRRSSSKWRPNSLWIIDMIRSKDATYTQ